MGLIHEKLTYDLRGCIYDVHNALGTGYDEESYHLALEQQLKQRKIPMQSKVVRYVEHREIRAHKFVADLIVYDKIILELKNLQSEFLPANYLQILSYLKCWKKELGLLVNFGSSKANIQRILFTEKEANIVEEYFMIEDLISSDNRKHLRGLRESILTIYKTHGLGYGEAVYQDLLPIELLFRNIQFSPHTLIPVEYGGRIIRNYEMKFPIIANQVICGVVALREDLSNSIENVRTYLRALNLPIGLLVHFGKEELEIIGVRP